MMLAVHTTLIADGAESIKCSYNQNLELETGFSYVIILIIFTHLLFLS
jgi:hypothetical protein